jgi:3-hydroxy-9,10-secoandrosta-1,3,5(10)-triene-9,17-dione monooxygenase
MTARLTGAELRERVAKLAPGMHTRVELAETERRVPDDSIRELTETGYFRAFTPERYGGHEIDLLPVYQATIEVARACSSTGWVAGLLTIHSWLVAMFTERAQDEVWSDDPDARVASSFAPVGRVERVDGGYVLNGRWPFSSGCDHCSWAIPGGAVRDGEVAGVPHFFLVPASDYRIEDDWHVSGLRGTGSKSLVLEDTFVPEYRVESVPSVALDRARGRAVNCSPLYGNSFLAFFAYVFTPAAIGAAREAWDCYRDYVRTRVAPYSGEEFRARPASQIRLAEAAGEIESAQLLLERDFEEMQGFAHAGDPIPRELSERMVFHGAYCVELCSRAVDRMFRASGGRALYETNPLQRLFRDVHAMTQHAYTDLDHAAESYGRQLLERRDEDGPVA